MTAVRAQVLGLVSLALSIACVEPGRIRLDRTAGDRVIVTSLESEGARVRVRDARWLTAVLTSVQVGPRDLVVAFVLPPGSVVDEAGQPLAAAELDALIVERQEELDPSLVASCGRVPAAGPLVLRPGARCPVPAFVRSEVLEVGPELAAEAEVRAAAVVQARVRIWIRRPGERACAAGALPERTSAPPPFVALAEDGQDPEALYPFGRAALASDGSLLLADGGLARWIPAPGSTKTATTFSLVTDQVMSTMAWSERASGAGPSFLVAGIDRGDTLIGFTTVELVSEARSVALKGFDVESKRVGGMFAIDVDRWAWFGDVARNVAYEGLLEVCTLSGDSASCASLLGARIFDGLADRVLAAGVIDGGRIMATLPGGRTVLFEGAPRGGWELPPVIQRTLPGGGAVGVARDKAGRELAWRAEVPRLDGFDLGELTVERSIITSSGAVYCATRKLGSGEQRRAGVYFQAAGSPTEPLPEVRLVACREPAACGNLTLRPDGLVEARLASEVLRFDPAGPVPTSTSCARPRVTPNLDHEPGLPATLLSAQRAGAWAMAQTFYGGYFVRPTADPDADWVWRHGTDRPQAAVIGAILPLDARRAFAVAVDGLVSYLEGPTRQPSRTQLPDGGYFAGALDHQATTGTTAVVLLARAAPTPPWLVEAQLSPTDPRFSRVRPVWTTPMLEVRALAEVAPGLFVVADRQGRVWRLARKGGGFEALKLDAPRMDPFTTREEPDWEVNPQAIRSCESPTLGPLRSPMGRDAWTAISGAEGVAWLSGCFGRLARVDLGVERPVVETMSLARPRGPGESDVAWQMMVSQGTADRRFRDLGPLQALCADHAAVVMAQVSSSADRFRRLLVEAYAPSFGEVEALIGPEREDVATDVRFAVREEPSKTLPTYDQGAPTFLVGSSARGVLVLGNQDAKGDGTQLRPQWPRPPAGRWVTRFRRYPTTAAAAGETVWVALEGGTIVRSAP